MIARERSRYFAAILVSLLLVAGVGSAGAAETTGEERTSGDSIQKQIESMTLEEKVGQMFTLQVWGQSVDDTSPEAVAGNQKLYGVDTIQEVVDKYQPGGIIYFVGPTSSGIPKNTNDPHQIAGLSNGIQEAALNQPQKVPMLISTDQEGGLVVRVKEPATQFPGSMALGATRNPGYARKAASITGKELSAMGINTNNAPDADVNVNPENPVIGIRSFGSRPGLVSYMTAAQVTGYQQNVAATAKHFPGHGDTNTDSHTGLPVIDQTKEQIEKIDLPPFEAAIKSGVDLIMSAHIVVPALDDSGCPDKCVPATLSEPILTGLLREKMGYDGVITTDALNMGALKSFGEAEVPVETIKAGADVLLMPPNMDIAYNAVLDAVESGEITEERIDESVYRILKLKQKQGLFKNPYVDENAVGNLVGTQQHRAAARDITNSTVTLVKNKDRTLPLRMNSGKKVLVTGYGATYTGQDAVDELARGAQKYGVKADAFQTGFTPDEAAISEAVSRARGSDLVVVNTGWANEQQQQLVKALLDTGKPVVVAAIADPYDIALFPEAKTYLATYGFRPVSMQALARVLFGKVNPSGRLPVSIPAADDPNQTLYPYGHGLSYKGRR